MYIPESVKVLYAFSSKCMLGGVVNTKQKKDFGFLIFYDEEGVISQLTITYINVDVTEQNEVKEIKQDIKLFFEKWWDKNKLRFSL